MKLAITLATRGRPAQLVETIKRSVQFWTDPNTCLYVIVDDDDPQTIEAVQKNQIQIPGGNRTTPPLFLVPRPRPDTIAEKWNAVTELCPDADVYLVAADDDPYITPGYDTKILDAASRFPDGIGVVYGHLANASFPGVMAPTRGFVDKLGYLFPPFFPYWFVDHWVDDVARLIDRVSFADVRTDQSKAGVTQEMREPAWWATWFDAAYLMRRRQAYQIIAGDDFQERESRKQMLYAHCPLIEYRSRWINENVRASSRQMEAISALSHADPRYQRIRQKAVEMVPSLLQGMDQQEAARFAYALTPPETVPSIARVYG
jgi:hypothetical protein